MSCCVVFFKQKSAYEMRISDWSSDVCSSDLGRSHHRGYAYFLVPSKRALNADAQKRLDAIETLGDLGSGFALATHDLEIRGAGELLGQDQSGQIEEVGFTMYAELLARAVKAIQRGKIDDAPFGASSCELALGVASPIPATYIPDVNARPKPYKRIAEAADDTTLHELKVEMIDRKSGVEGQGVAVRVNRGGRRHNKK